MSRPHWLSLCEHWVAEGRGNTGVTVPFLVGATQHFDGAETTAALDQAALAELLYELQKNCPADRCVRIEMCGTSYKPVVKLSDSSEVQNQKELVKARKGNSQLYVAQTYPHDGTMNSAVDALWKVIGPAVVSGAYSYRDGRYNPFTTDEMAFIKRAKHAA
jgi:hypothetical protein